MYLSEQLWCGDRTRAQFARSAQSPIIATTQILTHRIPRFSIIKWKIILLNGSMWKINKKRPLAKWNKDSCLFLHFYLHCVSGSAFLQEVHSHANALRWNSQRSSENLPIWKWTQLIMNALHLSFSFGLFISFVHW